MHLLPSVPFALFAALAPLPAQAPCACTKAVEIPASAAMGPARTCNAGIDVDIGGVRITDTPRNCPFFLYFTPTHHDAVPTTDRIEAHQYGTTSELLVKLACTSHHFLFIKIDTTCDVTGTLNTSALPLLVTRGCIDPVEMP